MERLLPLPPLISLPFSPLYSLPSCTSASLSAYLFILMPSWLALP
jgi:hypothetical protein